MEDEPLSVEYGRTVFVQSHFQTTKEMAVEFRDDCFIVQQFKIDYSLNIRLYTQHDLLKMKYTF